LFIYKIVSNIFSTSLGAKPSEGSSSSNNSGFDINVSEFLQLIGIIVIFVAIFFCKPHGMMEYWVWKAKNNAFYKKC
jgi:hypothetical protein